MVFSFSHAILFRQFVNGSLMSEEVVKPSKDILSSLIIGESFSSSRKLGFNDMTK